MHQHLEVGVRAEYVYAFHVRRAVRIQYLETFAFK